MSETTLSVATTRAFAPKSSSSSAPDAKRPAHTFGVSQPLAGSWQAMSVGGAPSTRIEGPPAGSRVGREGFKTDEAAAEDASSGDAASAVASRGGSLAVSGGRIASGRASRVGEAHADTHATAHSADARRGDTAHHLSSG